jgi:hypothetical protein
MEAVMSDKFTAVQLPLEQQINIALRRLLSEQNRDVCAPAFGCFDRRFWAWKLVDFPEATFQRNVYPLAWNLHKPSSEHICDQAAVRESVVAGLRFSFQIQHRDGSFDQAFPNEHSYGATAFLLQPLLESYKVVKSSINNQDQSQFEDGLFRAARFLCTKSETHGRITNHIAGAALSLLLAGTYFQESIFLDYGHKLINGILESQHPEGWFPEYDGADPGYQTLCLYYLAQAYRLDPNPVFKSSLERAVGFLSWFVHPDGSFGGEYGSRRTSVYYPGGIALLANEIPLAAAMTSRMMTSISQGHTVTLQDIDMGNLAPLLQSTLLALDVVSRNNEQLLATLPCDQQSACIDFQGAGLSIRSTNRYYAVIGIANGGVVKVFQKQSGALLYDDSGYSGKLLNGRFISTQMTNMDRPHKTDKDFISIEATFYEMLRSMPTPFQFTLLRILNLTLMRSIWIGNLIKALLVNLLIQGERRVPLRLERAIKFEDASIEIIDKIVSESKLNLQHLGCGIPFTSIHMASARYFQGHSVKNTIRPEPVDINILHNAGQITQRIKI